MAPGVSRPCVIVTMGVLVLGQAGIGAEGIQALGGHHIIGRELVGSPQGDAVHGIVAEDVLPLGEKLRAGRLAKGGMRLESRLLVGR